MRYTSTAPRSRDREYPVTRFTSIFTEDGGRTWHVYNDVTGHPVWADADKDVPTAKEYPTYTAARISAYEIGSHYRSVAAGLV